MENKNLVNNHESDSDHEEGHGFESFMESIENMDPEEAKILFQQFIAEQEEAGEDVPTFMRFLTSDITYGYVKTPVGYVYALCSIGHLIASGFFMEDDVENFNDEDELNELMEEIGEEYGEVIPPMINMIRDDAEIARIVGKVLDQTYEVVPDFFDLLEASDLQRLVWMELLKIPYGETLSYEELALRIGKPKAVRAVATAVGENPISIYIPCHRVILKNGQIGEYHWGSDIKEALINYEKEHKKTAA